MKKAVKGKITQEQFFEMFGEKWGSGTIEEEVTFVNPHIAWMQYHMNPKPFMKEFGKYIRRIPE